MIFGYLNLTGQVSYDFFCAYRSGPHCASTKQFLASAAFAVTGLLAFLGTPVLLTQMNRRHRDSRSPGRNPSAPGSGAPKGPRCRGGDSA